MMQPPDRLRNFRLGRIRTTLTPDSGSLVPKNKFFIERQQYGLHHYIHNPPRHYNHLFRRLTVQIFFHFFGLQHFGFDFFFGERQRKIEIHFCFAVDADGIGKGILCKILLVVGRPLFISDGLVVAKLFPKLLCYAARKEKRE